MSDKPSPVALLTQEFQDRRVALGHLPYHAVAEADARRSVHVLGEHGYVIQEQRPMVGISLMVVRNGKILLGKRKGSHGAGDYGTPGGHMEHGETFEEAAFREFHEECGDDLTITAPRFLCVSNVRQYLPKHYVDIAMLSHVTGGEPEVMEPDKVEAWEWHHINALPTPRFADVIDNMVIAYQTNQPFFA
jgi:8-oxo-dGTP diphosphatase